MTEVIGGMEVLIEEPPAWLKKGARVGVVANHASVDRNLLPAVEGFSRRFPGALRALFGPQHGFWGEKQDNMVLSQDEITSPWGVPIYSLYSHRLKPARELLEGIDVLIVDLQDVGCRVYTYATTLLGCLKECSLCGVKVVVTDRPNPIGGISVEGNLLRPEMCSFVGPHALPIRHGLTLGELASLFATELSIPVELEIVPMKGWKRKMFFDETGLPWVMPSPNLPTLDSCLVYPGQVLLEGTNLSEGRGTTRPFEIFGAPFVDPFHLRDMLNKRELPGVIFRPLYFEPTHNKWKGQRCGGLQLYITDRGSYKPYVTTLWILHEIASEWGDHLAWRDQPYEFETTRLAIDLLTGDPEIRKGIEGGKSPDELEEGWNRELALWLERRSRYLVYPE